MQKIEHILDIYQQRGAQRLPLERVYRQLFTMESPRGQFIQIAGPSFMGVPMKPVALLRREAYRAAVLVPGRVVDA